MILAVSLFVIQVHLSFIQVKKISIKIHLDVIFLTYFACTFDFFQIFFILVILPFFLLLKFFTLKLVTKNIIISTRIVLNFMLLV
jgi:hypothetical protein